MALIGKYKKFFWAGGLTLGALLFLGVYSIYMPARSETVLPTTRITAGPASLSVELATTPADRELGLSGRSFLGRGQGMLFTSDTPELLGIWMKDMQFSIDIIWADSAGTIVSIEHNVSPKTYPTTFFPSTPAEYVLEVPAGYAKLKGIAVGQKIVVK